MSPDRAGNYNLSRSLCLLRARSLTLASITVCLGAAQIKLVFVRQFFFAKQTPFFCCFLAVLAHKQQLETRRVMAFELDNATSSKRVREECMFLGFLFGVLVPVFRCSLFCCYGLGCFLFWDGLFCCYGLGCFVVLRWNVMLLRAGVFCCFRWTVLLLLLFTLLLSTPVYPPPPPPPPPGQSSSKAKKKGQTIITFFSFVFWSFFIALFVRVCL